MSPKSLFRLFNNQLGVSPQDYFKKLKIKQACFYLHYSQLNIEEIADELGFSSRYHFTRVFSSIRKIPPAAFRKIGNSYYNAIKRIWLSGYYNKKLPFFWSDEALVLFLKEDDTYRYKTDIVRHVLNESDKLIYLSNIWSTV